MKKRPSNKTEHPEKSPPSSEYDIQGPDHQPRKVMRQDKLGSQRRKPQEGLYTQDNEEEGHHV